MNECRILSGGKRCVNTRNQTKQIFELKASFQAVLVRVLGYKQQRLTLVHLSREGISWKGIMLLTESTGSQESQRKDKMKKLPQDWPRDTGHGASASAGISD